MLVFAHPWLIALIPLPVLAVWFLPPYRVRQPAVRVPFLPLMSRLTGRQPGPGAAVHRPGWIYHAAHGIIWLLVVLAIARPQWVKAPITKTQPMRDLLLAVDLSGSMETKDFTDAQGHKTDRLTAAKQVLDDFLSKRKGDRIGLIVFGSAAFVQVPFTDDTEIVRQLLKEVEVRMAGPKTALGDAMGLAITLFERSKTKERVMIVLTDGNDTGSLIPPDRAAEIARDNDITVYTVGMGNPETTGEEKLDEAALRGIAAITGGRYFFAADRKGLEEIYNELDKLTPRKVETLSYRPRMDLFPWLLALALLLSLLYHAGRLLRVILRKHGEMSYLAEDKT